MNCLRTLNRVPNEAGAVTLGELGQPKKVVEAFDPPLCVQSAVRKGGRARGKGALLEVAKEMCVLRRNVLFTGEYLDLQRFFIA
eukprot:scaffold111503_cov18-Tisochrysis_lutea.AAC.1